MFRVSCVSVGVACGGKHWSWPPRELVLMLFLVLGCFFGGGDAVLCGYLRFLAGGSVGIHPCS